MKSHRVIVALVVASIASLLAGCGMVSSNTPAAVTFEPNLRPPASLSTNRSIAIAATVSGDAGALGINWKVGCRSTSCGSFSSTWTTNGGTTQFTSPSVVPTGNSVTITATSVADSTKFVSATITLTANSSTLTDGTYVFHLSGTDSTATYGQLQYYVAGAFTVSAGAIAGGEQFFIDESTYVKDTICPGTSTISTTPDGNLQIILDTQNSNIGVGGLEDLRASFVTSSRALISQHDRFAAGTGTLDLQTSQALPSGGYAFFISGTDLYTNPVALGGIVNIDGPGTISGAGSVYDVNGAQNLLQNQTFGPSTVSGCSSFTTPDPYGCVLFVLNADIGQITLVGFIVDNNRIQLIETGGDSFGAIAGGMALAQGGNVGTFSDSSLSGLTYVIGMEGGDSNGPLQLAGSLTFSSSDNTVSGKASLNDLVSQAAGNITSGTYAVDPTGRVTITGLNGATFNNTTLQLYLDGNGNAFALSMDASDVIAGRGFQQSSTAISGTYAFSAQGSSPSNNCTRWSAAGQANANLLGVSGFSDFNALARSQSSNVSLSGTAPGLVGNLLKGTLGGLDIVSQTDGYTYYPIDNSRAIAIENDAHQLGLVYFELQQ